MVNSGVMEGPQMASGKNDTCIVKVKMIVFLYDIASVFAAHVKRHITKIHYIDFCILSFHKCSEIDKLRKKNKVLTDIKFVSMSWLIFLR